MLQKRMKIIMHKKITLSLILVVLSMLTTVFAQTADVPAKIARSPFKQIINLQPIANASTKTTQEQLISLNFQDIKVRDVLQVLAEFAGCNIITSTAVNGSITLHLTNIPWQQALDIILQTQNLAKKQMGNVLLIAPLAEMAANEKQQLEAAQQLQDLGPLQSELIQINYGKAADIATLLKVQGNSLLSSRGNASVDVRTNTLWVQDTADRVAEICALVQRLDVPVKQVLIEARIVNIDRDYAQELGVRFGVTDSTHLSGTLDGANAAARGVTSGDIPLAQRLNVDLPATGVGTAGGATSFGLALARLGAGTLLDLELSAMESEGEGQIISSPRLITADQQPAIIQSGEEIPYQQETSSGSTNVTFKNAVLSLSVTPQITPDGRLILSLQVNQDRPSSKLTVLGVPAIDTRSIQTQVLVNNGQTVVLGGIYETLEKKQVQRVPFFSALPVVGKLFINTQTSNQRRELLIFVTPKIIQ